MRSLKITESLVVQNPSKKKKEEEENVNKVVDMAKKEEIKSAEVISWDSAAASRASADAFYKQKQAEATSAAKKMKEDTETIATLNKRIKELERKKDNKELLDANTKIQNQAKQIEEMKAKLGRAGELRLGNPKKVTKIGRHLAALAGDIEASEEGEEYFAQVMSIIKRTYPDETHRDHLERLALHEQPAQINKKGKKGMTGKRPCQGPGCPQDRHDHVKPWKCEKCLKVLCDKEAYDNHKRNYLMRDCPTCKKQFNDKKIAPHIKLCGTVVLKM